MNQKINYQKKMEQVLAQLKADGRTPRLLLHSCCAPCSSYVLEYLSEFFYITDFYYNPNISPADEYRKRVNEMQRLIREMPMKHPVEFVEGIDDPDRFYEMAMGKEDIPEGGERCFECFEMRLREAAREAVRLHMDYFTTSLSISPLKDAQKLNEIGIRLGKEYGIPYLASDFKKKNGFRRSTELSREYNLYRQNYCGCVYSKRQAEREGRA